MLDLAIATLCSASIALLFKLGDIRGLSRAWVITGNYGIAFLTSLFLAGELLVRPWPSLRGICEFAASAPEMLASGGTFDPAATPLWGAAVGMLAGFLYLLGFLFYQRSVRESGMALSGSFGKLGILVPVAASILIWKEVPGPIQSAGVLLALASMVLARWVPRGAPNRVHSSLFMLFMVGGLAEFCSKIYSRYAQPDMQGAFLAAVFGTALVLSLPRSLRTRPRAEELLAGLVLGIPNVFASQFLIRALQVVPAPIAFSAYGAGSMLIINAVGVLVFREPLGGRQKLAVMLTALGLVMVNL
jgi:drug/metabolite transporter (DMT)-like permease